MFFNSNMAKRTTRKPTQKKTPQKRTAQRRTKKTKVKLDSKKVAIACACICAVCVLLLALTALSTRRAQSAQPQLVEQGSVQEGTVVETPQLQSKDDNIAFVERPKPAPKTPEPPKTTEATSTTPKPEPPSANNNPPKPEASSSNVAPSTTTTPKTETVPPAADFGFPNAARNAVLCIVFDDGGQNIEQLKKCIALPFPVTVAVMPRLAHSAESAALVRKSGNEVILHQPMQAINLNVNPGAGAILPEMTGGEIAATLAQNIAEIAPISGMNNHEGSLITEDEVSMSYVLETLHQKGIYFLDSRTSSATKVPSVSMEMGYGYYQRDIFLDNQKTRENILNELKRGVEIANRQGYVIMIGHVWSAEILPAVLAEVYPELKQKGYRFSTVSKSGAEHK